MQKQNYFANIHVESFYEKTVVPPEKNAYNDIYHAIMHAKINLFHH